MRIDRNFVDSMEREPEAFALVCALLGFGLGPGLTVTAEGVEKQAQPIALQQECCQQVQGHLGRAMSARRHARLHPELRRLTVIQITA
jgi:EAL domain-containing protein (putative c-di-GMP-specific phosphodiesterase class I)